MDWHGWSDVGQLLEILDPDAVLLLTSFLQRGQEKLAVVMIGENGFPPIPAVHDMVERSRVLKAKLPGHRL